jgi:hypothetical protein
MQLKTTGINSRKDIPLIVFNYGEGDFYRIRLGRWHRFVRMLSIIAHRRNDQSSFFRNAGAALSQVKDGGKRSCQAIIL